MALRHNSKIDPNEPDWSAWISKNRKFLPLKAFAIGDPEKKTTWKYPHHWVKGGVDTDGDGIWDQGEMFLHKGGLDAAWRYAQGARSGKKAPQEVIDHLKAHYKALGIEKEEDFLKPYVSFTSFDDENKVVKGVVYAAGYIDSDGETMDVETVRKMAWQFLAENKIKNIDISHNWLPSGCVVVESYFQEKGNGEFPDNAWILAVKCTDEIWEKVKKGELNGFSIGGTVEKSARKVLVEINKVIMGKTEENSNQEIIPPHTHDFIAFTNEEGRIVKGVTTIAYDHFHIIDHETITKSELDHTHRIILTEEG